MSTPKVTLTSAQRRAVADLLALLADRLELDKKNARTIAFTLEELESIRKKAVAAQPHAENGMKRNSLRHVIDAVTDALEESRGTGSIPAARRLYQFKITLLHFKPAIWRRIQVKNGTLDKLHEHIQTAMGWTNSHLHQFEIDGELFGDPELLDNGFDRFEGIDSTATKISEIIAEDDERFRFHYEYDFGDAWEHEVLFERCLRAEQGRRYPLCVDGRRRCPPEDVGGVWGYADFLEAIADPSHEEHDRYIEWGGEVDPERFDPEQATRSMRRGVLDWRQYA